MSGDTGLRVALLDSGTGSPRWREAIRHDLPVGLAALGHEASVVGGLDEDRPVVRLGESVLRGRGFTPGLTRLPMLVAALRAGDFDLVHAFTAADAWAARLWRRRSRRPVVFTCAEVLDRTSVADARQRLRLLEEAVTRSDALLAAGPAEGAGVERWLAREATVLSPEDVAGHDRLYRALAGGG